MGQLRVLLWLILATGPVAGCSATLEVSVGTKYRPPGWTGEPVDVQAKYMASK